MSLVSNYFLTDESILYVKIVIDLTQHCLVSIKATLVGFWSLIAKKIEQVFSVFQWVTW